MLTGIHLDFFPIQFPHEGDNLIRHFETTQSDWQKAQQRRSSDLDCAAAASTGPNQHVSAASVRTYSTVGIHPVIHVEQTTSNHTRSTTPAIKERSNLVKSKPSWVDDTSGRTSRCLSPLSLLNGFLLCSVFLFPSLLLLVTRVLESFPDALWWRTPGTRETNIHLQ